MGGVLSPHGSVLRRRPVEQHYWCTSPATKARSSRGCSLRRQPTHICRYLGSMTVFFRAQIDMGTASYRRHFGTQPHGFWLPECAYRPATRSTPPFDDFVELPTAERPAIDQLLATAGLQYFIVDARQLRSSAPDYMRHSPCRIHWVDGQDSSAAPVALFTRDFETTARVWQHDTGYPGDPVYLEFHKKQREGGLRYWRITDRRADLAYKQPYVPEWAFVQVRTHAIHFAQLLRERLRTHWQQTGERGIVVAAFDTELLVTGGLKVRSGSPSCCDSLRRAMTLPLRPARNICISLHRSGQYNSVSLLGEMGETIGYGGSLVRAVCGVRSTKLSARCRDSWSRSLRRRSIRTYSYRSAVRSRALVTAVL